MTLNELEVRLIQAEERIGALETDVKRFKEKVLGPEPKESQSAAQPTEAGPKEGAEEAPSASPLF